MHDPRRGVCLSTSGADSSGKVVWCQIKAWAPQNGGALHWDAQHMMENVLCYENKGTPDTTPHRRWIDIKARLTFNAQLLDKPLDQCVFRGPQSFMVKNRMPDETVDAADSCSTTMVLAMLCDSMICRKPLTTRRLVTHKAMLFVEAGIYICIVYPT